MKSDQFKKKHTRRKYILRPWNHGGWELVEFRYFPDDDKWKQRKGWAKYLNSHAAALTTVVEQIRSSDIAFELGDPNVLTQFHHIHKSLIDEALGKLIILSPDLSKQPVSAILRQLDTTNPKRQTAPMNVF